MRRLHKAGHYIHSYCKLIYPIKFTSKILLSFVKLEGRREPRATRALNTRPTIETKLFLTLQSLQYLLLHSDNVISLYWKNPLSSSKIVVIQSMKYM